MEAVNIQNLFLSLPIVGGILSGAAIVAWQLHKWDKTHEARHTNAETRLSALEIHSHHTHRRDGEDNSFAHKREEEE